ncbi:Acyltransferase family protein [Sphingomonas guangdongensis]|uniref:Acyltransferase family protein n=1 Tax=Sphingomonas guangdongensis TaxID=1141890 RepID=A0A285R2X4_9SPHN|nr:acyltransferase family protein [Sphingomonas guangdongensis]SOB86707.1 Acyltransferase family protein [Sphingomonas guangdongensis]
MRHEPRIIAAAPAHGRHFGMDWLRIAAFAVLIVYHAAMVFAPWDWLVKAPRTYPALIPPMAFVTPWRLALLFAVSGYASRILLDRSAGIAAFLRSRAHRLLVPLAFGMVTLVPLEMWVRVRLNGYSGTLPHFWMQDYWRWGELMGVGFPSWEHLWFVAYLAAYTGVLAGIVATGRRADRIVALLSPSLRLLWLPLVPLIGIKLALLFVVPEQQGLLTDWAGHAEYFPLLVFGFVLAGHRALWASVHRVAPEARVFALAAGLIVVSVEWNFPAEAMPPHGVMAIDRAARIVMAWSMTLALFAFADRHLDRDHRWRGTLARAVFPAYLLHHTALVVAAWWFLPLGLHPLIAFLAILAASIGICVLGYLAGSRIGWLGTLIGLPPIKQLSGARASR